MSTVSSDFYRWWVVDPITGERVLTPYKLTSAHAAMAFPGAEPDLQTRETRELPDLRRDPWGNTRPGEPWEDSVPVDPWAETMPQPTAWKKAPGLGETVALPSGILVKLTAQALQHRPWKAVEIASRWYVSGRPAPNQTAIAFFTERKGGSALEFDEADAVALAKILNAVR